jgi:hypothetical protein
MASDQLISILTDIRDQQKRQIEEFERAIAEQQKYLELQKKGRQVFLFMVYAPWLSLALVLAYLALSAELL